MVTITETEMAQMYDVHRPSEENAEDKKNSREKWMAETADSSEFDWTYTNTFQYWPSDVVSSSHAHTPHAHRRTHTPVCRDGNLFK